MILHRLEGLGAARTGLVCATLLLLTNGAATADQVYKSIDESGHVSYSSSPPANAVESKPVDISPGPSAEQQREAEQRAGAASEQARALEREREEAAKRAEQSAPSGAGTVLPVETSGTSFYPEAGRLRPRPGIPSETPGGGDHPVYAPGKGAGIRPGNPSPARPAPLPAGR